MKTQRTLLLAIMLVAIGLRSVLGAPCCAFIEQARAVSVEHHAHKGQAHHSAQDHVDHSTGHSGHTGHNNDGGHSGHGDDPSANPCCSACGPTLPPEPTAIAKASLIVQTPEPAPIRAFATRPPFPFYEARGPPLLI